MTPEQALSLGIFAINTMLAPDASSDEDVARLDAHGHEAVEILAQLRDSAKGLERALPDPDDDDEGLASERATRKARGDIGWEGP